MRVLSITVLLLGLTASSAEPPSAPAFPLWDGKETVEQYAKRAGLEPTKTLDLGDGTILELVLIPAGKFLMGVPKKAEQTNDRSDTQHEVTLTKPFYIGKYEVVQEQYKQVMGTNPSEHKGKNRPVEMVSWNDAQEFCKKASEKSGQTVRLPTEAEWEHGCRAGTTTTYYTGDAVEDLAGAVWDIKNSKGETQPIGQKIPNAWGLYDMLGNVWEWVQDFYAPFTAEAAEDPQGPPQGKERVMRGGSCWTSPWICGMSPHMRSRPERRDKYIGFRVVVPVSPKAP